MTPNDPALTGNAYELADYYTCRDPDCLTCESPEEAIEEQLDGWGGPGTIEADIRAQCPITVVAYSRRTIPDRVVAMLAEDAVERIDEYLCEDFSDPNQDGGLFSGSAVLECIALLTPAIRAVCDKANVWACEEVGKREYGADEVIEMMKEHCPEWFEEKESAQCDDPS